MAANAISDENPAHNPVVPDDLDQMLAEDEGLGVSHDPSDQSQRLIRKLEPGSPACIPNDPARIPGAEPGMFLVLGEVHEDLKGVLLCGIAHYYVEWLPGRQGFVTRHADLPTDVDISIERGVRGARKRIVRESGNIIQDTKYCYVLFKGEPFVLPLTGTGHQFARDWRTYAHKLKHPRTGGLLPIFAHRYRLYTVGNSVGQYHWHSIKFEDQGSM
jgi:hypothetical protein